MLEMLSS